MAPGAVTDEGFSMAALPVGFRRWWPWLQSRQQTGAGVMESDVKRL